MQLNWDTGLAANGPGEKWLLNVQPVIPFTLGDRWNDSRPGYFPLMALIASPRSFFLSITKRYEM